MVKARVLLALLVSVALAGWAAQLVSRASADSLPSPDTSAEVEVLQTTPGVDVSECNNDTAAGDQGCPVPGTPRWSCELDPQRGIHVRVSRGVCP